MNSLEFKILKAIKNNKLNPEIIGERNWFNYFIRITELVWDRNNYDGYKIEVYNEKHGKHLTTIFI